MGGTQSTNNAGCPHLSDACGPSMAYDSSSKQCVLSRPESMCSVDTRYDSYSKKCVSIVPPPSGAERRAHGITGGLREQ